MRCIEVCPICTNSKSEVVYPSTLRQDISSVNIPDPYSAHYQINQCITCDLRFSSPILDEAGVTALYVQSENGNIVAGEEGNVKATMKNYYKVVQPHLFRKERVLDVGCDVGYFLEAALEDGCATVYGLEPTKPARETAQKLPNSKITAEFYEAINYADDYFDLIAMVHVLDHLVDPSIALKKAKRELRTGGLMFAVVHNSKSVLGVLMGEKFPVYNLYHHYFFTKSTLAKLFKAQGFQVVRVLSTKNCYSLRFFIIKSPLPGFLKKLLLSCATALKIEKFKINLPVGNIGIVARKI